MDYEITPEAIIETAIDATFVQRGMLASRHRDAVMKALDDGGYSIVPKDEIKKFRIDDLSTLTPLITATRKLQSGRDIYAPVIIDHLNQSLAISLGLTVAEIDALLAAVRR